jgi:hypothetical protein
VSEDLHAKGLRSRTVKVADTIVRVTSYEIGTRFSSRVDNLDPGGNIARGRGNTREEAEEQALSSAALALELLASRKALRQVTENLQRGARSAQAATETRRRRGDPER